MLKKILMISIGIFVLSSCSKVPAGNVGIKVYLLGGAKGVDSEELGVGRYWIGINEELYIFPTFKQNYVWTKAPKESSPNDESFTFQTKEGLNVGADIGITYHLDPTKVHSIFQKYRRGVDEITDIFLRNHVRDALVSEASTMGVQSVYGSGKKLLIDNVEKSVRSRVSSEGLVIENIYLIGSFRLPPTVTKALNAKIEATQRAQQRENELREAEAQAKKKIAEASGRAKSRIIIAQAEADANKKIGLSLTSNLIEYERTKKWDGKLPQVSGSASIISIGKKL